MAGTPKKSAKSAKLPSSASRGSKVNQPKPAKPEQAAGEGYRIRTRLIHGVSKSPKWDYTHHVVPPMSSSATFRLSSTQRGARGFFEFACDTINTKRHVPIYIYDRLDEPTRGMLEESLATAEGGDIGVCFATGMAAITAAIQVLVRGGDHVVAHDTLYGCTYSYLINWLPRQGVSSTFVNACDAQAVAKAITPKTRVVYLETPVNPNLELVDLGAIRAVVDRANRKRKPEERVRILVDNTFCTPYCQRPLSLGADVVIHSLTKGIGGFGTDMGGAVITSHALYNELMMYRKDFGGVLSPKAAWNVLVYGLPSLAARMANMQRSAMQVAQFLEQHPKVARVMYPGLPSFPQRELAEHQMVDYRGKFAPGSMIYFTLKDRPADRKRPTKGRAKLGEHPAERFINYIADHAYCVTLAVSLGQVKSLIESPYHMTHSAYLDPTKPVGTSTRGLEPGGIRLSVGLEDWQDIIGDLEKALERA